MIDARVLPDDNHRHLVAVTFLPPLVGPGDGMHLRIEEIP